MFIEERKIRARKKDLMVVPVSGYSFKRALEEQFYAFPKTYGRDRTKKYLAFYQTHPIKAITHYARIRKVKIKPLEDFSARDILIMFGHRADKEVVVFELGPLIELKNPVKSDGRSIQGVKYSSLNRLLKVEFIKDI